MGGFFDGHHQSVFWSENRMLPKDEWRHVWKEEEDSYGPEKWRLHDLSSGGDCTGPLLFDVTNTVIEIYVKNRRFLGTHRNRSFRKMAANMYRVGGTYKISVSCMDGQTLSSNAAGYQIFFFRYLSVSLEIWSLCNCLLYIVILAFCFSWIWRL